MKEILQRVRGAVADKDLVPVLTHFHVYAGRIQGGNGEVCIDVPSGLPDDWEFTVPAVRFLKAVDACKGEPKFTLAPDTVRVSRGRFRATLPLAPHDTYPRRELAGSPVKSGPILRALRKLRPFVGTDAHRPWALGVVFSDGYAYATNNIVIARCPCEWEWDTLVLPTAAVDELLRLGEEPRQLLHKDGTLCATLQGGAWLSVVLTAAQPPDLGAFAPQIAADGAVGYDAVQELAEAVAQVAPFCPDPKFPAIVLDPDGGVGTAEGQFSAQVAMPLPAPGKYHLSPLGQVLAQATWVGLEMYPKPVPWRGDGIDGLLMGLR